MSLKKKSRMSYGDLTTTFKAGTALASLSGRPARGANLQVVHVPDPGRPSVFVITAYELRGRPLVAFKRRQRKKPRR